MLLQEGSGSVQGAFDQLVKATVTEIMALRHETLSRVDTARGFLIQSAITRPPFPHSFDDNVDFEFRLRMFAQTEFLARQRLQQLEEVVIKLNMLEGKVSKLACQNATESGGESANYHILSLDYGIHVLREGQRRLDILTS